MRILSFMFRLAAVVALIGFQVFLAYQYGVEDGVGWFLTYQCGLHLAATVVAPPYLRVTASACAGWASAIMAVAVAATWVTCVMPVVALMGIFIHGDFTLALYIVGATAYLAIPAGIYLSADLMNDM